MTPRRGRLPDNFRAEALRQAREAQRLRVKLNGMGERIAWYVTWLSGGGIWNVLRDACGQGRFVALAAKVDLDPLETTAKDVFLTALSTVSTRNMAWRLILRFSTGVDHKTFLEIWRMEENMNALAQRIFYGASYLYRGESIAETVGIHDGTVDPDRNHSFVSLSSNPTMAIQFAFTNYAIYSESTVVLAIDAHSARKTGVAPATYSLVSDVLDLPRSEEDVDRTFPMSNIFELQAHFPVRWPPRSDAAMVAIITVLPLLSDERYKLENTDLPILNYMDIFPHDKLSNNSLTGLLSV
ncbi:MAG: hypothetical protein EB832_04755 [Thaumarchaeota archaeon S14]|nr:MAG: hypothetical protein EB832_04755 [Thaumarchaeota archaeon S14]